MQRADLNLLVIFEAIYTQGGVTRAAEVLHLTQPTISHALARLREWIGDPLFVRHGQRLVPTPVAHKMIAPVRRALQTIDTTLGELKEFDPGSARMAFSLGLHPLMENTIYFPLVRAVRAQAPFVSISSVHFERRNLEADLSSGALNAAVDVFLPVPDTICKQHILQTGTVVIARRGHPGIDGELDLEAYLALEHIVVSLRRQGGGPEDVALAREGRTRNVVARCQHINTALRIVATSDLVLTMSDTFANHASALFDNRVYPAPFATPPVDAYLYWHANSEADQANQWLRAQIGAVAADADIAAVALPAILRVSGNPIQDRPNRA